MKSFIDVTGESVFAKKELIIAAINGALAPSCQPLPIQNKQEVNVATKAVTADSTCKPLSLCRVCRELL